MVFSRTLLLVFQVSHGNSLRGRLPSLLTLANGVVFFQETAQFEVFLLVSIQSHPNRGTLEKDSQMTSSGLPLAKFLSLRSSFGQRTDCLQLTSSVILRGFLDFFFSDSLQKRYIYIYYAEFPSVLSHPFPKPSFFFLGGGGYHIYIPLWGEGYEHQRAFWVHLPKGYVKYFLETKLTCHSGKEDALVVISATDT